MNELRERLRENLGSVRGRIAEAARRAAGRDPVAVTLVAVTKKNPPELIRPLLEAGALDLGENYPQELWKKAEALADADVRWHLIGHLQGNKAKKTLPLVRMVHAVDSLRLLQALDALAAQLDDPPSVCLQVNTSGEAAKHGWSPSSILEDAGAIVDCRRIPVVGLMTMAALDPTPATARASFARLREPRGSLRDRTGLPLEELSMGMSGDFEEAIAEGATLVRVGSALFRRGRAVTGLDLTAHDDGTILPVRAQPGARRDAVVGMHAGALRVSVSAQPEKGKANAAIRALLAEAVGCKAAQVDLLSGETARQKRFLIRGLTPDALRERLARSLPPGLFDS